MTKAFRGLTPVCGISAYTPASWSHFVDGLRSRREARQQQQGRPPLQSTLRQQDDLHQHELVQERWRPADHDNFPRYGVAQHMSAVQAESTNARYCFPCVEDNLENVCSVPPVDQYYDLTNVPHSATLPHRSGKGPSSVTTAILNSGTGLSPSADSPRIHQNRGKGGNRRYNN